MTRPRARRVDYALFETFLTRWRDNDVYGHLNNAVYYEYVDTIVNRWLIRSGALDVLDGAVVGLVVETGCTFHASLGFPEPVEAGLRVDRIGRSSVTYGIGLFAAGESLAAAEARFTHVCVDRDSRRPVSVPAQLRAALETLRVHVQSGA
jgi:acyl-CoA thioester hydrolase